MTKNTFLIIKKDLLLDFRSKENFFATFFFAVIVLTVFHFSLGKNPVHLQSAVPGIYWVTFLFSGILTLRKAFQTEQENLSMEALFMTPAGRGEIYMGKLLGNCIFILFTQILVIPVFGLFLANWIWQYIPGLLFLCCLGTLGFSAIGVLLAAVTADVRFSEILLPLLLFPLMIPLLLACVRITHLLFQGKNIYIELDWFKLLVGFDLIFLIASYLLFHLIFE